MSIAQIVSYLCTGIFPYPTLYSISILSVSVLNQVTQRRVFTTEGNNHVVPTHGTRAEIFEASSAAEISKAKWGESQYEGDLILFLGVAILSLR